MWSRLLEDDCSVGIIAKERYDINNLQYHNWKHILACYEYLQSNRVPYDIDLDYAVLYHDIVYDSNTDKEYRSYEAYEKEYGKNSSVKNIIMATKMHNLALHDDWRVKAMVRADLSGFTNTLTMIENYVNLVHESIKLYDMKPYDIFSGNIVFMDALKKRIANNDLADPDYNYFWNSVYDGINKTKMISEELI